MSRRGRLHLAGSDGVRVDQLIEGVDSAILDADSTRHGLMPKLSALPTDRFGGIGQVGTLHYLRTAVADVNYTAARADLIIAYTSLTASRTVTPGAASSNTNRVIVLQDESGSASALVKIIFNPNGAELVNGFATWEINAAFGSVTVYSNGVGWFVMSALGGMGV